MKKRMWAPLVACAVSGALLAGCSAGAPAGSGQAGQADAPAATASAEPSEDAVKIDEIKWDIDRSVVDGQRRVTFGYENHSSYEVVDVKLEMKLKSDVTYKELAAAFPDSIDGDESEEEQRDLLEQGMTGRVSSRVPSGETSPRDSLSFLMYYIDSKEQADLFEPDLLTVRYLNDGNLYEEYYDYRADDYSLSSDVIDTEQWTDSEIGDAVPRPEGELVDYLMVLNSQMTFSTIGTTEEGYYRYLEKCQEAGFTKQVEQYEENYNAQSEDGAYDMSLMLTSDGQMTLILNRVETPDGADEDSE